MKPPTRHAPNPATNPATNPGEDTAGVRAARSAFRLGGLLLCLAAACAVYWMASSGTDARRAENEGAPRRSATETTRPKISSSDAPPATGPRAAGPPANSFPGGRGRLTRIPWEHPPRPDIRPEVLDRAIRTATAYLVRSCDAEGRFVYERDLATGEVVTSRYNVLRHAGAMYALATAYRREADPRVLEALRRAAGFLRRECLGPLPDRPEISAVWSDPRLTGSSSPRQAKLGGAGLGLVALVELEQLAPGSVPREELRRLGRFLVFMQKPDGSFYSKYFSEQGRDDSWTSLYYPGEASLGALMLYDLDRQPRWLRVAGRGVGYLARDEAFEEPPLPDHWMLLALRRLLPNLDQADCPVPRGQLLHHARRTCRGMLTEQVSRRDDPLLAGCFGDDGRTAPAATRLEGLLAARGFLPPDDELCAPLDDAIRAGIEFLLRCQILEGPDAGAVPMAQGPLPPNDDRSSRFNPRVRRVRIDYVQHALCAMIEYEQQFVAAGPVRQATD